MTLPDPTLLALTLLGVTIPVFIFSVTFLGDAIQRARLEEEQTKAKQQQDFQISISDLENKVKAVKAGADSTELEKQLKVMRKSQKKFQKELTGIQDKYSLLGFSQGLLFPGAFFAIALVSSEIAKLLSHHASSYTMLWILSVLSLGVGAFRLAMGLKLAQEISTESDQRRARRTADAFKIALREHEEAKSERVFLTFRDVAFPLNAGPSQELTLSYRVGLSQGKAAHNVEAWFYVPDGFDLIVPPEKDAWRQGDDFVPPRIRTVKTEFGTVRGKTYNPSILKLKTPAVAGTYYILYRVISDEYETKRETVELRVTPV